MLNSEGNNEFTVYVEGHGEPGVKDIMPDRLWIEIRDKDDMVIPDISLPLPAVFNANDLVSGNIQVPHKEK